MEHQPPELERAGKKGLFVSEVEYLADQRLTEKAPLMDHPLEYGTHGWQDTLVFGTQQYTHCARDRQADLLSQAATTPIIDQHEISIQYISRIKIVAA